MTTATATKSRARKAQVVANPVQRATRVAKATIARMRVMGKVSGAAALGLTALSLTHLAEGICLVTKVPMWQGITMAGGIDLGFITTEVAMICATEVARKEMTPYAKPLIIGTVAASAFMNVKAFTHGADGLTDMVLGGTFGAALPFMIFALARCAMIQTLAKK